MLASQWLGRDNNTACGTSGAHPWENKDNMIKDIKQIILESNEMRSINNCKVALVDHVMIYSEGEQHVHGMGIAVIKDIAKSLIGFWHVS